MIAAKWEHVDLEKGEWYVPPSNQKSAIPHFVLLSAQALELFKELRKLAGKSPMCLRSLEGRRDKPMSHISKLGAPAVNTQTRTASRRC